MQKRKAFTMIELVFVIVVMGILSKFGAEFLAQAYRNFIFSSVNNKLQAQSAIAVELIAKRLESRVKGSVVARTGLGGGATSIRDAAVTGAGWNVLEWVSEDTDGFRGIQTAYWSGVLDLDSGTTANNNLPSPGSNFGSVAANITNLGGNGMGDAAIVFIGGTQDSNGYGWDGALIANNAGRSIHPVGSNANALTGNFLDTEVFEFYKLAWTANGIVHDFGTGELWFYTNYQPWNGESTANATRQLIMENVSSFQFVAMDDLLKIQVCVNSVDVVSGDSKDDAITVNQGYAICKDKTIF